MNTNKHTQGPWWPSNPEDCGDAIIYHDDGKGREPGEVVAYVVCNENENNDMPDEETQANARLIAAAPELLAVLEGIFKSMEDKRGVIDWATSAEAEDAFCKARAAIAKAKSE